MVRLLNIEFIKLWNSKWMKVLILVYFIILSFIGLISVIKFDIGPVKFHLAEMGIFNFPYIWHLNTYIAAQFKLFLAIVIIGLIGMEYGNRTVKQNLIDGVSKKEFVASKFLMALLLTVASTLFIFLVSLILGAIYSDYNELSIIFSDQIFIFAYALRIFAFFSLCLFAGFLTRRSIFAIGFLVVLAVVEGIVWLITAGITKDITFATKVKSYLPLGSMSNLIDEPITRLSAVQNLGNQLGENMNFDYAVHWYEIVIVLVWTALFIYWSYALLKRRDL